MKELKAKEFIAQIGITHELKGPVFSQISMNISQIISFIYGAIRNRL
jgi:hypothetical protein